MGPTLRAAAVAFGGVGRTAKQQIRAQRRTARRDIAATRDLAADGERLAVVILPLLAALEIGPGDSVTAYEPFPEEPQVQEVCRLLTARGARILVPITLSTFDLEWTDLADPARNPLGENAIGECRLVLVPGLSVDTSGTRIGQAGGCYDRALPRTRPGATVVAVLHPGELLPYPLPHDSWDQPVDAVLTADGLAWTAHGIARHGPHSP